MGIDDAPLIEWLLEGDPAIRWQTLRDLVGADAATVRAERARVAEEGWGAQLLSHQDQEGTWDGQLYSHKWISTTYTLLHLHWLGLPSGHPQALLGCAQLFDRGLFADTELGIPDLPPRRKRPRDTDQCVTAMMVLVSSSLGYEDERVDLAVRVLLREQLPDGGWNCMGPETGSQHGSFHTSITALEALAEYEREGGRLPVAEAQARGREFFLEHHLYCSHRTGEAANPAFTRFPFPPQWHFDVLRGLEHFAAVGADRDPRLADAVAVVRDARKPNGRWPAFTPYPGRTWFGTSAEDRSRWNTLRALRMLRWWTA
ncbi:MAG: hypothetical protein JW722_01135 [Demequinaceae bacterium]|nr:hypothetical protein [Demequinaceae bacterium]